MAFGCNPQINICLFFRSLNLSVLAACRHCVSCEGNSSYNFTQIFFFFKLCICFCECLKNCMRFGCNPHIIYVTFLQFENITSTKALIHWVSCERTGSVVGVPLWPQTNLSYFRSYWMTSSSIFRMRSSSSFRMLL